MIKHETKEGLFRIEVGSVCDFTLFAVALGGSEYIVMNRDDLTELRAIIDQALNTSAEELEAPAGRLTLEADEPLPTLREPRIDFR